jgi:hypothetical protein
MSAQTKHHFTFLMPRISNQLLIICTNGQHSSGSFFFGHVPLALCVNLGMFGFLEVHFKPNNVVAAGQT